MGHPSYKKLTLNVVITFTIRHLYSNNYEYQKHITILTYLYHINPGRALPSGLRGFGDGGVRADGQRPHQDGGPDPGAEEINFLRP
jgi:hypothetical protein